MSPKYIWETIPHFTSPLYPGQLVELNTQWPTFEFLSEHFGKLFPQKVESISGDVVRVKVGSQSIEFARQTLEPCRPNGLNHKDIRNSHQMPLKGETA